MARYTIMFCFLLAALAFLITAIRNSLGISILLIAIAGVLIVGFLALLVIRAVLDVLNPANMGAITKIVFMLFFAGVLLIVLVFLFQMIFDSLPPECQLMLDLYPGNHCFG